MFDEIDHGYPTNFHVLSPFVSMVFINLVIPNVYWDYG